MNENAVTVCRHATRCVVPEASGIIRPNASGHAGSLGDICSADLSDYLYFWSTVCRI